MVYSTPATQLGIFSDAGDAVDDFAASSSDLFGGVVDAFTMLDATPSTELAPKKGSKDGKANSKSKETMLRNT